MFGSVGRGGVICIAKALAALDDTEKDLPALGWPWCWVFCELNVLYQEDRIFFIVHSIATLQVPTQVLRGPVKKALIASRRRSDSASALRCLDREAVLSPCMTSVAPSPRILVWSRPVVQSILLRRATTKPLARITRVVMSSHGAVPFRGVYIVASPIVSNSRQY